MFKIDENVGDLDNLELIKSNRQFFLKVLGTGLLLGMGIGVSVGLVISRVLL